MHFFGLDISAIIASIASFVFGVLLGPILSFEYQRWREQKSNSKSREQVQKENMISTLDMFITLWNPVTKNYPFYQKLTKSPIALRFGQRSRWLGIDEVEIPKELENLKPELSSLSSLLASYLHNFSGDKLKKLRKIATNLREMSVVELNIDKDLRNFIILGHEAYIHSLDIKSNSNEKVR